MIFKKLKLKNIRSYEDLEVEFPKGSILLSGDIGTGKTSILLALQFALFGLQPGQKATAILRQGENEAYVSLEFEIEGKTVIIERTLRKSKNNSITQETSDIIINGERSELSTSEMKNKVITLLDYPREFVKKSNLLYKFTVYTPQEEMKEIINERPEVRLDTLRHVFGVDRYKRIKENSEILLQKIKESIKIKEASLSELSNLKERFVIENESKIKLSREINNLNLEYFELLKEKQENEKLLSSIQKTMDMKKGLDSELVKQKTSLQGKNDLRARIEKEISSMNNQIKEKIDFSADRLESVSVLLDKHKRILEDLNQNFIKIISKMSVFNSKKEDSMVLIDKVSGLDNCPTCYQKVEPDHKEKMTKIAKYDIEEINRQLEQVMHERKVLQQDIDTEKALIKGYEEDKLNFQRDKIKFEHQKTIETKIKSDAFVLDRAIQEIEEISKKIPLVEAEIKKFEETETLFKKSKLKFDETSKKVQLKEISLAEKNKELEISKKNLASLQEDISKKEKIRGHVNYLRELQDWLQEKFLSVITLTEKNVLAKLRSEFSKIFSEWFAILVPESLLVRLDEDFTPIIVNRDFEIDYDFLSGGERTAVALAYRLALNQVLNSLLSRIKTKDIVILDEPTDGFSEQQLDKMREIFEQLNAEQIILVSHEQKIEGFVDHVIRVSKEGKSKIEYIDKKVV